jgi:hypothetical protein
VELDRIIFGDNQFFGINHRSEEKAQEQAERFKDINAIIRVVDTAYESGIHAFMFTTHDKVASLCDHFQANPARYSDLHLYPSIPYAHKYANAVNEKGMIGALNDFLFSGRTAGQAFAMLLRGGRSIVGRSTVQGGLFASHGRLHIFCHVGRDKSISCSIYGARDLFMRLQVWCTLMAGCAGESAEDT